MNKIIIAVFSTHILTVSLFAQAENNLYSFDGKRAIHECKARLTNQTKRLEDIFKNVRNIRCLEPPEQQSLDLLENRLYTSLDKLEAFKWAASERLNALLYEVLYDYQDIQTLLGLCRTSHIVGGAKNSKFQNDIDNKLFLVALGDLFGADSGFEGSDSAVTLGHRLNALKRIQESTSDLEFIRDSDQIDPCKDLRLPFEKPTEIIQPDLPQSVLARLIYQTEVALKLHQAFKGSVSELRAVLAKELKILKKGESIFLPFGWTKHAFSFQITREEELGKNSTYNFRIFNSGDGISAYHASLKDGYSTQYFPYLEVAQVPQKNLLSLAVLKGLQEIAHPETYATKAKLLYENMIQSLGGKPSPVVYDLSAFRDPQNAGTCTYFQLRWLFDASIEQTVGNNPLLLKSHLPSRIEFLIDALTLEKYARQIAELGPTATSDQQYRLLQKGLTYLSSSTLRSRNEGSLSLGDAAFLSLLGERVGNEIKTSEQARRNLNYATIQVSIAPESIASSHKDLVALQQQAEIEKTATESSGKAIVLGLHEWKPKHDASLVTRINEALDALKIAQDAGYFIEVTDGIAALASYFPLDPKGYWKDTSEAEAIQLISAFRRLEAHFAFSLVKGIANGLFKEQRISTKGLLVALKLLALSDLMNQHFLPSISPQIPSLAQPHFAWLLSDKSALIDVKDPIWIKQREILKAYFTKFPSRAFFGFDIIPAGVFFRSEHRIFHDPLALQEIEEKKLMLFESIEWPVVSWASEFIKQKKVYDFWLKNTIERDKKRASQEKDYIEPFKLGFWDRSKSSSADIDPVLNPDYPVPEPVFRNESETLRRDVLKLLSLNAADDAPSDTSWKLPSVFYDLRASSYLFDWLLTAQLDVKSVKDLTFSKDLHFKKQITSEYSSRFTGKNEKFLFEEKDKQCIEVSENGDCGKHVELTKIITKELSQFRSVAFKATTLSFEIFGGQIDNMAYPDAERKLKPLVYTRPYVHGQHGIHPFDDLVHEDLMRIYTTGISTQNNKVVFDPLVEQERKRILPNELVSLNPVTLSLKKLTLQRVREIFTLSGHRNLQLTETLALFDQFPSLLLRTEYQRIFEDLMLEENLFEKELEVSPGETMRFLDSLVRFIKEHTDIFSRRGNLNAVSFMLQMNQQFKLRWNFAKGFSTSQYSEGYDPAFYHTQKEFFKLAQSLPPEKVQERSYLHRNIVESYANVDNLDASDVELLLIAFIEHKTIAISDPKWDDPFLEDRASRVLIEKQAYIQKHLFNESGEALSESGQGILKKVALSIRPDLKLESQFRALVPETGIASLFSFRAVKSSMFEASAVSETGPTVIRIDVNAGTFYDQGQTLAPFPLTASEYAERFGNETHPHIVQLIAASTYTWKGGSGRSYKIQRTRTGWIYQMLFEKRWYQYIPERDLDFDTQGFFSGYDHWQSVDNASKHTFHIFDALSKAHAYTTQAECKSADLSKCQVVSTQRISDSSWLAAMPPNAFPKSVLQQIELPLYIYVWLNNSAQRTVKEVVLPRLGLTFRPLGKYPDLLDCADYRGYQIAQVQYSGVLNRPVSYLVCEPTNRGGPQNRLAMTPIEQLTHPDTLTTLSPFDFSPRREKAASKTLGMIRSATPLAIYKLPALKDGIEESDIIEPTSDAARLYLAMRLQWQLNYSDAKKNLEMVTVGDRILSTERFENHILSWMFEKNRVDSDPQSLVIQLLAAITMLKQSHFYDGKRFSTQTAKELYELYLSNLKHLPDGSISYFDELLLARTLVASDPNFYGAQFRLQLLEKTHPGSVAPVISKIPPKKGSPSIQPSRLAGNPFRNIELLIEKIFQGNSSAQGQSVLNASGVIAPVNFDILYEISRGVSFDKSEAFRLIKLIIDAPDLALLSAEKLREEWLHIFAINARSENPCAELSRFFLLLSQMKQRSETPPASDLRKVEAFNEKQKSLDLKIKRLDLEAQVENNKDITCDSWKPFNKSSYFGRYIWIPVVNLLCNRFSLMGIQDRLDASKKQKAEAETEKKKAEEDRKVLVKFVHEHLFDKLEGASIPPTTFEPNIQVTPVSHPQPIPTLVRSFDSERADQFAMLHPSTDPLKESLLPKRADLFEEHAPSPLERVKYKEYLTKLHNHLNQGLDGPTQVASAIQDLNVRLHKYVGSLLDNKNQYTLKRSSSVKDIIDVLGTRLKEEQLKRDKLLKNAVTLAHQHATLNQRVYQSLVQQMDSNKDLAIDELTHLLGMRSSMELNKATNGHMNAEQLATLRDELFRLLLSNTFITHAKQFLQALETLQGLIATHENESSESFKMAIENVVKLSNMKRAYDPQLFPEYLMLEQYMGFLLKPEQVLTLDRLGITSGYQRKQGVISDLFEQFTCLFGGKEVPNQKTLGAVIEMAMGSGKTSVLLPLLSMYNSRDNHINIVMLPEALAASMSKQLSQQLAKGLGQAVDVVTISRSTKLDKFQLESLYYRFKRAQTEHRTVVITNSSMQSLFLSFIAALHSFEKGNSAYAEPIQEFIRIFQLLRQFGRLTIDEVDLALDILQSHQFSVGNRVLLDETLSNTVFAFYREITSVPLGVSLPFMKSSQGRPLTSSTYAKVKNDIIDRISSSEHFFKGISVLDKMYRHFISDATRKQLLKQYLSSKDIADREKLFDSIDETYTKSASGKEEMKTVVTVLFEEINKIFMLTASKKLSIHYGPLPKPTRDKNNEESEQVFTLKLREYLRSRFIAIPYHSGNPVSGSRFGTSIEALNYTLQMHIEQRDFLPQMRLEVETLKKLVGQNDPRFESRFDKLRQGQETSVFNLTDDELKRLAANLTKNGNKEYEFGLWHDYVLPQLTTYEVQLQTNAQIYEALFKSVQGFSGTLWSVDTFPDLFKNPILSNTEEKTFFTLWSQHMRAKEINSQYVALSVFPKENFIDEFNWKYKGSFIDEGGLFRGVQNQFVACNIASDGNREVIFYDDENNIQICSENGQVSPIEEVHTVQPRRVAYWDKKHTTGSDLKLTPDMTAQLSFDHHLISRDLQQAAWRLRGLETGQTIPKYVSLKEDLEIIKLRMQEILKTQLDEFDLGELILYSVMNQELKRSDLLFRGLKQKMRNVIINDVFNQILSSNKSANELSLIYAGMRSLFEKNLSQKPYLSLGFPFLAEPRDVVLSKETATFFSGTLFSSLENPSYESGTRARVQKKIQTTIESNRAKLPDYIFVGSSESEETEIELELEQEKETEQEQQSEIEMYEFDPLYTIREVFEWKYQFVEEVFENGYFTPLSAHDLRNWTPAAHERPLTSLRAALSKRGFAWLADEIHSDLWVSLNFAPVHASSEPFNFFSLYQKNLTNLLIIMDANGRANLMLIDNNDAVVFDDILKEHHRSQLGFLGSKQNRLALYSITEGIFRNGLNPIRLEELAQQREFTSMLAQIKFFNGEINYTPSELEFLEDWMKRIGVERMYKLFSKQILAYKQDSRQLMRFSTIGRLFDDLRD